MMRKAWKFAALIALFTAAPAVAADAYLRVVDVGNGLCVVARLPGGAMLFDAGDEGSYCLDAVKEIIPGDTIDLIVLSHSDSDHIGELPEILAAKHAKEIIHTGDDHIGMTAAIGDERKAIHDATVFGAHEWNLAKTLLPDPDPTGSRTIKIGEATVTVIAGWPNGDLTRHADEKPLPTPEHNNALSVVVRLEHGGHSVLLTGDTVGRFRQEPPKSCAYAERFMVENAQAWPIRSDVLIGQHHGGDNASSNCFIRAVAPRYVVFSAGHKRYHHPTQAAADRFTAFGVNPDNMLRTDRGDDEGKGEWVYGDIKGCIDQPGDDDVEIVLPEAAMAGDVRVSYRQPAVPCPVHQTTPRKKKKRRTAR